MTLARHGRITLEDLLPIYVRSSKTVRPILVSAIAWLKPSAKIERAIIEESALHRWVYEMGCPLCLNPPT